MTGPTFPSFMSSCMMLRSSLFGFAKNVISFCFTNHDNTNAVSKRVNRPIIPRPLRSPTMTHIPLGFGTRLHADNEWLPTQSKIRSYRCPRVVKSSNPDAQYKLTWIEGKAEPGTPEVATGAWWMNHGLRLDLRGDFQAAAFRLDRQP